MIALSKATGVKFSLRKFTGRLILFILPIIVIAFSYYVLIVLAREGTIISDNSDNLIKTFFDIAYPVGDVVILITVLLVYGCPLSI